jgi:TolA-binding protein
MKFMLGAAATLILLAPWSLVTADEPPVLDFVRGLRAQGMPDLALEYLQSKSKNPPADLAPLLPLELARTRLELAATRANPTSRAAEQNQARAEFELFVKNNPKHPLAAAAQLEIGRITAIQGKAQFVKARGAEKNQQQPELTRARSQLEEAGKGLQAAATQIDAQLAGSNISQAEKQSLAQARLQAALEIGINFLDQAMTFGDQGEAAKRGELFKKAADTLEKLSKRDDRDPICWQAHTWLGRTYLENEDPKMARKIFNEVIAEPGEYAEPAKRLARYFRLQALQGDGDQKKILAEVRKAAEEWLTIYPNYVNTPEGCGVRFELAQTYVKQALAALKNSPQARALYEQAQKYYQSLEQPENEFSAQAHENNMSVLLQVSTERSRGDIGKLQDFAECYLRARLEVARINEEAKTLKGSELEDKRKEHYRNMLQALNRGLDLANGDSSADEVAGARFLLSYAYLALDDYYRAAVVGEDLARTRPRAPQAPLAAAYALRSYSLLIAKGEEAGAAKEDMEPDRARLRRLAQYIEQTWPSDQAADIARHTLGLLYLNDKNYPEAVAVLDRVSSAYPEATRAFFLLAGAALQAQKENVKPPAGAANYQDRALAALLKIPDLRPGADAATVRDFFSSRQLLADIYYRTKQFDKMEAMTSALVKRLDELDNDLKAEQRTTVVILDLYAKLGRAETEYNAGHYDKARALLEPVVKAALDPAKTAEYGHVKDKDPGVLRVVLGLALRANVQDNQVIHGKEILDLLQRTFPDNSIDILVQFVRQLNAQIKELRARGEPARKQLDQTIASVSTFLDVLAKQQEKSPNPELTLFLAQSYSSLDNHARAAELASKISEPGPDPVRKEIDPKALGFYRAARTLVIRELRLAAAASPEKDFSKAEAALKEVLRTPWGKQNIDAQMERIKLLEDQEKYLLPNKQGAIHEWNKLMLTMQQRLSDNRIKEQYFDCYYHMALCIYKNAQKIPDEKKKKQNIHVAANYIFRLDAQQDPAAEVCKKRFQELVEQEPPLKEEYEELKKASGG